jgi:arsenite oxidase small subunit
VNSGDPSGGTDEFRRRMVMGLVAVPLAIARASEARAAPDQPVAHLSELAQPWSAVKFNLPDVDGGEMPCIVIRLPGDKWYASSLICSHNKCTVMYVLDVNMVRDSFNVDSSTPVLACPCHFSVFDPAQDGRVLGGPAPNPPLQLRVAVRGNDLFVSR